MMEYYSFHVKIQVQIVFIMDKLLGDQPFYSFFKRRHACIMVNIRVSFDSYK